MNWQQIEIFCDPAHIEMLEDYLFEQGAVSFTTAAANAEEILFDRQLGQTELWQATKFIALFTEDIDCDFIMQQLTQQFNSIIKSMRLCTVADQDWQKKWMENYQPIQISKKLWICPSWHEPVADDAINIMLDPGLAFGTGTHPTTAMCLQWLEQNIQGHETVIDFGCGSGILAIAALKLGCKKVFAIDIDPQALEVTRENATKNGIPAENLITILAPTTDLPVADIVVANILANPLIELASQICSLTKKPGKMALSGLLKHQAAEVKQAYTHWLMLEEFAMQEDWVCLQGFLT